MQASDQASIDNDTPGSGIGQGENPLVKPDAFFPELLFESVNDPLWNESRLTFFATLGLSDNNLRLKIEL